MLKIIKAEKTDVPGFRYSVRFNKELKSTKYFNDFAEALSYIDNKSFDMKTRGWLVDEDGYEAFKRLDEKLFPPKKTMKEKMSTLVKRPSSAPVVTGWERMGVGMKLQPYDYQKKIVKFIVDQHGPDKSHDTLVVAPCGSGKTPSMLCAYLECHHAGIIQGPGMIVVKASLKVQWAHEVKKFTDLRPKIIQTYKECVSSEEQMLKRRESKLEISESASEKKRLQQEIKELRKIIRRKFQNQFEDADLFIVNYETLRDTKVQKALLKINPQFVAADEIHYVKGDATQRAKALAKFNGATVKIGATATPVQRDPRDIYGIFKVVHPELFKKKTDFNALYVRYGYGYRVIGAKNVDKLNQKISPYMFILSEEEVSKHLPSLVIDQRFFALTARQQKINDAVMEELDDLNEKVNTITRNMTEEEMRSDERYLQLSAQITTRQTYLQELTLSEELFRGADNPLAKKFVTGDGSPKLEGAIDLIGEILDSGGKVCIFSRFAKLQPILIDMIHAQPDMKNEKIACLRGEMSSQERFDAIESTKNDDCNILIMSDAGAEGINLSHIQHLIELEPAVSYAIQTQRHGRIKRADSKFKTGYIHQMFDENSWDDIGRKVIEKKEKYDQSIVHGIIESEG